MLMAKSDLAIDLIHEYGRMINDNDTVYTGMDVKPINECIDASLEMLLQNPVDTMTSFDYILISLIDDVMWHTNKSFDNILLLDTQGNLLLWVV